MSEIERTNPVVIVPDESLPPVTPVNTLSGDPLPLVSQDREVFIGYDRTTDEYDEETGVTTQDVGPVPGSRHRHHHRHHGND